MRFSLTKKEKLFYAISIGYIAATSFCIAMEWYWILLLPVIIATGLFIALSFDKVLFLIALLTPISLPVTLPGGIGFNFPTEPLLFGIMMLFFFKLFKERTFDKNVLRHSLTFLIIANLLWILFTTITSTMPIISLKFFLGRLWLIVCWYFLGTQLFKQKKNIYRFIWLYSVGLLGIIGYTFWVHLENGFSKKVAHWAPTPFYGDHTGYAAVIAVGIFLMGGIMLSKSLNKGNPMIKFLATTFTGIFLIAVVLSFTRAAWISILIAGALFFFMQFRFKLRTLMLLLIGVISCLVIFQKQIVIALEDATRDSDKEYVKQIHSIYNISTDDSNTERLNRWSAAIRMFKEKPIVGFGPGTYSFQYGPYQRFSEMTIISTTTGDKGNAHSEYLGPLSESGIPGLITWLCIVFLTMHRGMELYYNGRTQEVRILAACATLALTTYFVHGLMNNFLDIDKAGVPIWAMIAMIVTLEIYHNKPVLEGPEAEQGNIVN
jgi:putative inorganic carbon (HCO3(-)) transporter